MTRRLCWQCSFSHFEKLLGRGHLLCSVKMAELFKACVEPLRSQRCFIQRAHDLHQTTHIVHNNHAVCLFLEFERLLKTLAGITKALWVRVMFASQNMATMHSVYPSSSSSLSKWQFKEQSSLHTVEITLCYIVYCDKASKSNIMTTIILQTVFHIDCRVRRTASLAPTDGAAMQGERRRNSNGCSSHHHGALTVSRWSVFRVQLMAASRDKQPSGETCITAWARAAVCENTISGWTSARWNEGGRKTHSRRSGLCDTLLAQHSESPVMENGSQRNSRHYLCQSGKRLSLFIDSD